MELALFFSSDSALCSLSLSLSHLPLALLLWLPSHTRSLRARRGSHQPASSARAEQQNGQHSQTGTTPPSALLASTPTTTLFGVCYRHSTTTTKKSNARSLSLLVSLSPTSSSTSSTMKAGFFLLGAAGAALSLLSVATADIWHEAVWDDFELPQAFHRCSSFDSEVVELSGRVAFLRPILCGSPQVRTRHETRDEERRRGN